MKTILFLCILFAAFFSMAQTEQDPFSGLPVALPDVHAVCETVDLSGYFEKAVPGKLKTGTHAAVYKLTVDCHGTVMEVLYQRGTLAESDQAVFTDQLAELTWKPAQQKSVNVTSFVFVTLEIVNGRVTVIVQ